MRLSFTCYHLIQLADLLQYKVQLVDNEIDGPPLMSELTRRMTDRSHFLETPSAAGTLVGEERLWSATSLTVRLAPLINERRVKAADSSSNFLPENPKSNIQII